MEEIMNGFAPPKPDLPAIEAAVAAATRACILASGRDHLIAAAHRSNMTQLVKPHRAC